MIMRRSKMLYSLLVAGLLAFSSATHAAVYEFGSLLTTDSGYTAPNSFTSDPFAQLVTEDNGGGMWTFTLSINNNLFSSFGDQAFLGSMSFDFTPDPASNPVSTFIDRNEITSVLSTSGNGLSGLTEIDFGTGFGQNASNRLSENDWVKWSVSGLSLGSSLTNMYVHLQGLGANGEYSAKYTVTVVPEPETYAMLLAGLGLIGFTARRRKQNT
jgi:hypothetical protein